MMSCVPINGYYQANHKWYAALAGHITRMPHEWQVKISLMENQEKTDNSVVNRLHYKYLRCKRT